MDRIDWCNELKKQLDSFRPLAQETLKSLRDYYRVGLTYSSNALEGNSLTESETKVIIEDGFTIRGKPLKDVSEALGHASAYDYLQDLAIDKPVELVDIVKLHELFYQRINPEESGRFRKVKVFISGSRYPLPGPDEIPDQMEKFMLWLRKNEGKLHPVELAAEAHRRFVFIHPFIDGNGRVARLLMNLVLIRHGYPVTIIPPVLRPEYIALLERAHKEPQVFTDFVMERVIETLRELIRLLGGLPQSEPMNFNSDQAEIMSLLKEHPGWRVPNLVQAAGKSRPTIERYLRKLREQGLIEFRGAPKNGGYFVK